MFNNLAFRRIIVVVFFNFSKLEVAVLIVKCIDGVVFFHTHEVGNGILLRLVRKNVCDTKDGSGKNEKGEKNAQDGITTALAGTLFFFHLSLFGCFNGTHFICIAGAAGNRNRDCLSASKASAIHLIGGNGSHKSRAAHSASTTHKIVA